MIDTLWALGQRLNWEGIPNPFAEIRQTYQYESLAGAQKDVVRVGEKIAADGLPESITPLIVGIAGYGNVSRGVQEILSLLPTLEIEPDEIEAVSTGADYSRNHVYKVVFREEHISLRVREVRAVLDGDNELHLLGEEVSPSGDQSVSQTLVQR